MVTMDAVDKMMKDAAESQVRAGEELQEAETISITGVQLNDQSKMVYIYHRESGQRRELSALAAQMALMKKYRTGPLEGQYVFSAKPTSKKYHIGKEKCLLHPDNPQRAQFDTWGLPVCESEHLASPGEARLHLKNRHHSAWEIIERAEAEKKQNDQIEAQKALAAAILATVQQRNAPEPVAPLYVSDKKK